MQALFTSRIFIGAFLRVLGNVFMTFAKYWPCDTHVHG
jgi:hypothetical protein